MDTKNLRDREKIEKSFMVKLIKYKKKIKKQDRLKEITKTDKRTLPLKKHKYQEK